MATPAPSAKPSASPLSVWPLPAALVDRRTSGIFIVKDVNGQQLAYLYILRMSRSGSYRRKGCRATRRSLSPYIAKLPCVPRQIVKDIPRPPVRPVGMIERLAVCLK